MKSPIVNRLHTTFIPVTDLKRSARWYSELIGEPFTEENVHPPVYNLPMTTPTGVTLDAGLEHVTPSSHPLFNFHTEDIDASYRFVEQLGYTIKSDIQRFEDVSFFNIQDPDGNIVMICTG
ncbi:VOC family protein [Halobacillus sp. Nhm2S1]|uniref:VOC family protein n=1 Tax=Halobacillus sp. Nhm2S1 TaxID=2866716 RepID=UPI001C72E80A|nr:VOC family protein [Halobacillus sp. Nhm2S1]MBX0358513.1 VOC family protein [Halobacillus sp. Nhm2S1]